MSRELAESSRLSMLKFTRVCKNIKESAFMIGILSASLSGSLYAEDVSNDISIQAIISGEFEVPAVERWGAGFVAPCAGNYEFFVSGLVEFDPAHGLLGPDGHIGDYSPQSVYPDAYFGALIGLSFGVYQTIGSYSTFYMSQDEPIRMLVNDGSSGFADNSGSFDVEWNALCDE